MNEQQIETLKKMIKQANDRLTEVKAIHTADNDMAANATYYTEQVDTLRAALDLAEQARAMEGWEAVTYLRGNTIATRQGDGQWYIEDETRFKYLSYGGIWSGFESREVFADAESALAAANAAMKAGE